MLLTYRYKLRPTRAQYAELDRVLELQRLLYNACLQERIEAWRKARLSISKLDQNKSLTQIRSFDAAYAAMPACLSRWSIAKVDDAMGGFFKRVRKGQTPGFPRFRGMGRWTTFGFAEWKGIRLKGDRLLLKPFATGIRVHLHRALPSNDIRSCTFTRKGRHWFVCLVVDVAGAEAHEAPGSAVGIEHLLTTSEGEHVENVRPRSRRERQLRIAQQALARCKRGSKRRRKVKERLRTVQRRILQARDTHLHQVSAALARRYETIGVEDLRLRNMTRSARGTVEEPGTNVAQKAGLNRSLLDAAPGKLIQMLTYKAEKAGGKVVRVDPRNTSQACSSCGTIVRKALDERRHRCTCGLDLHRDHNAALNVMGRAMPPGGSGGESFRRIGTADAKAA